VQHGYDDYLAASDAVHHAKGVAVDDSPAKLLVDAGTVRRVAGHPVERLLDGSRSRAEGDNRTGVGKVRVMVGAGTGRRMAT
jgi:hypothetical protein